MAAAQEGERQPATTTIFGGREGSGNDGNIRRSRATNSRSCVFLNFHKEANSRSLHVVVAALATEEAEVAESVDEKDVEGGDEGTATNAVAKPKPKKGKAALPLKRDRSDTKLLEERKPIVFLLRLRQDLRGSWRFKD
ncbi:50S ribosomal protein L1, chloroplastic-like [Senna tora]|uniref:50S ribosomal protein L1, chloroplastic-like n=1 Tax=Senna tora TaxID=362788 RepID=A0A835CA20_9FABA|nr:50S ribosomal protein L1, chloroplastic-like [Senna tora]